METQLTKSQKTRVKILQIAKSLFEKQGFQQTNVKDITQAADLGYGTFYLHFKDKKELFLALLEDVENDLYIAADSGADIEKDYPLGFSSYRALRKDLRAILASFERNADLLRISQELAFIDSEFAKQQELMRKRLIERTKQILEKSTLANVNYDIAAIAIAGMIEAVGMQLTRDGNLSIDDILPTISKLYFKLVA